MCFVTLAQLFFGLRQSIWVGAVPFRIAKMSILTTGMHALADAYLMLFHSTLGLMFDPVRYALFALSFFEFILFVRYDMTPLVIQWRLRRIDAFATSRANCELAKLYGYFYSALLALGLARILAPGYILWFAVLMYSFWIPQVRLNPNIAHLITASPLPDHLALFPFCCVDRSQRTLRHTKSVPPILHLRHERNTTHFRPLYVLSLRLSIVL